MEVETVETETKEAKMHIYIAERKQGFNFVVQVGDERTRVRFVDGQFKTDDAQLAKAIDKIRKTNAGIGRRCRKADKAAADKLAREHREMLKRTGAVKGGLTAEAARHAMDTTMAKRDIELRSQNVDVDKFAEDGLQLTEEATKPPEKTKAASVSKKAEKPTAKSGDSSESKIPNLV